MEMTGRLADLIDMVAHSTRGGSEESSCGSAGNADGEMLQFDPQDGEANDADTYVDPLLLKHRIRDLEHELELVRGRGKLLAQEVDLFRQRRVVFWSDRFRNSFDAWNMMNPGFQQLKDDSSLFNGSLKGYRLQPSLSLLRVAYLTYRVKLNKPNLKSILLAPVVDVPLTAGELCLRIFSEPDTFVCSSTASVTDIRDDAPTLFEFPSIADSDRVTLNFTVHVQGVDAPVRIFELRRYAFGGFGRLSRQPFAGYVFG